MENTSVEKTQVRSAMENQDVHLSCLMASIEKLETALQIVLQPSQPSEKEGEARNLVPLAAEIESFNDTIHRATRKIQSILERLEL